MTVDISDLVAIAPQWGNSFAAQANEAMRQAFDQGCGAVLLLRSDIALPDDARNQMLGALRSTRGTALLGGCCISADSARRVVNSRYWWDPTELAWRSDDGADLQASPAQPSIGASSDSISLAFALIPRGVWETTGPLDERFGAYLTGVDYSLRVRSAGFDCRIVHGANASSTLASVDFEAPSTQARLNAAMLVAKKHSLPCSANRLAWRMMIAAILDEVGRVDPAFDYGVAVSPVRRRLWYTTSVLQSLSRPRLRQSLGHALSAWRAASTGSA